MCEVRIVPEGTFWSVTIDDAHEERERFPTLESAVAWSLQHARRSRPATVSLAATGKEMVLLRESALAQV